MDELTNIDDLLDALEKKTTPAIMSLTPSKIKQYKNDILQRLGLERERLKMYHKKLKNYRYCTDVLDIQDGRYIRWISLKDPSKIKLTNGAFVSDKLILNNGIHVQLKNTQGRIFQIKYDECEIFQKITHEENLILEVLKELEK
tara:strand:+ start:143 stop:574 length:432 start_codon:yes stop_codon:yes gene_type:complete